MRILIVEDDVAIAAMLKQGLENAKYTTDHAADGASALTMASENTYAAVILDLMLPVMDGWRVCEELRRRRNRVPILMLTARDAVDDRVRGLDSGADDYLPKPFDFSELMARVRALLRRDRVHRTRVVQIADLVIDTAQRVVTRAGVEIGLSHREYELLAALAGSEGRVFSREVIQEQVWGNETAIQNTVDVYIGMLRKKIDSGHAVKLIHTVHGAGYTVRAPEGGAS